MYPCSGVDKLLVTSQDFRRLWSVLNISGKSGGYVQPPLQSLANEHDEFSGELDNQVSPYLVAIYEAILYDAVSEKASDVHLEVYQQRVRIRLRVDGDLYDLQHYQLTPAELAGVVNVLKTRAQLDISEHRLPQGGRSRLKVGDTSYDLRVQTQPSLHGEHAVIRLLPQSGHALTLKQLGMLPGITKQYRRLLDNPSGLVLIVGPTGSGKTTTLSAGLQELADDGRRKVITVEDPIEYAIDNIQQTHVRSSIGFGFADAMRSFVRQDPDVILVGEIRDAETALESVRASQTGHLVLSTLHCNDAVDAIQRLFDLGLHHNSLASELLAVMAQQLAKRICSHCREPAEPDPAILAELFPEQVPDNFHCFVGKGCPQCSGRGTKGRIAVVEFLQVNSELRDVISRRPPLGELRWRALDAGLVTMRDSALELVLQGVIPLSELPRILPEERLAPEARGGNRSNA
jgi:type IV pilus assembly protein PilB